MELLNDKLHYLIDFVCMYFHLLHNYPILIKYVHSTYMLQNTTPNFLVAFLCRAPDENVVAEVLLDIKHLLL